MSDITKKAKQYTKKKEDEAAKLPKGFNHDDLLKALYHAWDVFERSNVEMFLVGFTGRCVSTNQTLAGKKLDIGIRRMEWTSGGRRIIDAFAGTPVSETPDTIQYVFEGVPVFLHVYDDDLPIQQLNTVMYFHEAFKLPNPFTDKYV